MHRIQKTHINVAKLVGQPAISNNPRLVCLFYSLVIGLYCLFSNGIRAQSFSGPTAATGDSLYHLADSLYESNEFHASCLLFNQAAQLYKQYEMPVNHTDCLIRIAQAMMRMQQYPLARQHIDSAKHVVNVSGLEEDAVFSDLKLAEGYYLTRIGDYRNAIVSLQEALEIRAHLNLEDYNLSRIYSSMGESYYHLGNLTKAYTCYKKSVNLREKLLEPGDIRFAAIYNGLGVALMDYKGHYDEAMEYLNNAVRIYETHRGKNFWGLGAAYTNLGLIFEKKGDFPKALGHHKSALRIYENQDLDFSSEIARIHNNIGLIHLKMGDHEQALEWLQNSLDLKMRIKIRDLSSTYNNIAETYRNLGNNTLADQYFHTAITNHIEVSQNHAKLARYYLNHGQFCIDVLKDFSRGKDLYGEALHLCQKYLGEKHPVTARAYYNLGGYFEMQDHLDSALYYIQKSITSLLDDFAKTDYRENPDREHIQPDIDLLRSLKKKADLTASIYDTRQDLTGLELSFSTRELVVLSIEKIRMTYQTEESKLILSQNEKNTFDRIIHDALRLFEITEDPFYRNKAFEYTEKSKSANLLAAIRTFEAEQFGGIPDELLQEELNLRKDLSSYKELVYEERMHENQDTTKIRMWEDFIFTLQKRIDSLIGSFEKNYSTYYSLKFNTDAATPVQLSETITSRDAILEYIVTDTLLIAFLKTKDHFLVRKTRIDSLFHFYARFIRDILTSRNFSEGVNLDFTQFVHASAGLYDKLIRPFASYIKRKNLIVIPDESLAYIPFEILLTHLVDTRNPDYSSLPYLIRTNPVSYSYSATLLSDKIQRRGRPERKVLALAPKYKEPRISARQQFLSRQQYRDYLYPIPGATEEVEFVHKLLGGDILLDEEATEASFKARSSRYDILHLAMHTILDDVNPMYSKLVFTETPGDDEDDLLNTFEIYNLKLSARLAVLSSCNSGTGKLQKGEGVMSLARGFIYAGCPSIVMTLWEVEDKSGVEMMRNFYHYLKKGYVKDEALRKAKLEFLQHANMENAHPYFWSAFVNIGDPGAIFPGKGQKLAFSALILLILAVTGVILFKKRFH